MNPRDNDRLDQWLDSALNEYGKSEPRAGLEGRVLANLSAQARPSRIRSPWPWALAGASAAVLLVGFWLGVGHRVMRGPNNAARDPISAKSEQGQPQQGTTPTAHGLAA